MTVSDQTLLSIYTAAMIHGDLDTCIRIEEAHGLFGYPPEMVSVALKAIDDGMDPGDALSEHFGASA